MKMNLIRAQTFSMRMEEKGLSTKTRNEVMESNTGLHTYMSIQGVCLKHMQELISVEQWQNGPITM